MSFIVPEHKRLVHPGQQFSRLTVIGIPFYWKAGTTRIRSSQAVVCKCECGETSIRYASALTSTKAFGCHRCASKTHGMSFTRLHRIWTNMKSRCLNRNNKSFVTYGNVGIVLCDEWLSFDNFRKWAMSNGYSDSLTIDRIKSDGNYEPSNCRWATYIVQNNNRRHIRQYEGFGETKTIGEWSRDSRSVVSVKSVWHRLVVLGWDVEQAITIPVDHRRGRRVG